MQRKLEPYLLHGREHDRQEDDTAGFWYCSNCGYIWGQRPRLEEGDDDDEDWLEKGDDDDEDWLEEEDDEEVEASTRIADDEDDDERDSRPIATSAIPDATSMVVAEDENDDDEDLQIIAKIKESLDRIRLYHAETRAALAEADHCWTLFQRLRVFERGKK